MKVLVNKNAHILAGLIAMVACVARRCSGCGPKLQEHTGGHGEALVFVQMADVTVIVTNAQLNNGRSCPQTKQAGRLPYTYMMGLTGVTKPYLDTDMQSRWFDFGGDTIVRADK